MLIDFINQCFNILITQMFLLQLANIHFFSNSAKFFFMLGSTNERV